MFCLFIQFDINFLSLSDHKILCLGLIQSLFEGSMYVFVLEWTPALTPVITTPDTKMTDDGHRGVIPHGHIFSAFMVRKPHLKQWLPL